MSRFKFLGLLLILALSACGTTTWQPLPYDPVNPTPAPSPQPQPVPIDDTSAAPWSAMEFVVVGADQAVLVGLGTPWQSYTTPAGSTVKSYRVKTEDGKVHNAHITLVDGKITAREIR